jgi:hypothetical protein
LQGRDGQLTPGARWIRQTTQPTSKRTGRGAGLPTSTPGRRGCRRRPQTRVLHRARKHKRPMALSSPLLANDLAGLGPCERRARVPELSGTVSLGDERTATDEARICQSDTTVRLLAPYGSPASKRSWVRTSLLLWMVGAGPAGRAHCRARRRPSDRDRANPFARHCERPDEARSAPPPAAGFAQMRLHRSSPARAGSRRGAARRPLALSAGSGRTARCRVRVRAAAPTGLSALHSPLVHAPSLGRRPPRGRTIPSCCTAVTPPNPPRPTVRSTSRRRRLRRDRRLRQISVLRRARQTSGRRLTRERSPNSREPADSPRNWTSGSSLASGGAGSVTGLGVSPSVG